MPEPHSPHHHDHHHHDDDHGHHAHPHGHDHGHAHSDAPAAAPSCGCPGGCSASPSSASTSSTPPSTPLPADGLLWLSIPAMDCAAEEADIRRALTGLDGIRSLRFQLGQRRLGLDAAPALLPQVLTAIAQAGYTAQPLQGDAAHAPASALPPQALRYALALLLAVGAEGLAYAQLPALAGLPGTVAQMALAACAIALAGLSTYRKGLSALRQGRIGINALMTVAVTGAFLIGQWPEAAMVMALYAIAELIEARAVDRARHAIQGLLALAPETAEVCGPDGQWAEQTVAQIGLGQTLRIRPGARIALDAVITQGQTSVDQSAVTGESLPVERTVGDTLLAGTVNLSGTVQAQVSAAQGQTLLARIIDAVEQAQSSRAPTQALVDRFAAVYTPAVFAIALGVALLGPWLAGWTALQALYKALVLLVIACPCALVISTPVTLVSALAAAARRGIVIKGGLHLEQARRVQVVALDKTGTLTTGRPTLVATEVLADGLNDGQTVTPAELLHWAHDLAAHSDHPVARAIAAGLAGQGCTEELSGFTALPGLGLRAQAHGQPLWLGNARLMAQLGLDSPALQARLAPHEAQGRTVTLLACSTQVLALLAVADIPRPEAASAIAALQAQGVQVWMLSGDHPNTAQAVARQAGLDDSHRVRGGLLPQDKQQLITGLQAQGLCVAMVGDGINDAPALASADLGVALGRIGTDIAIDTADITLMHDDLRRLPELLTLSRRTHAILLQNIALALGIKAVFLILALQGSATMWMAVFADMGASLLVVGNGLRALRPSTVAAPLPATAQPPASA